MQAYVLSKDRMAELVAALRADHRVVGPVSKENGFVFDELDTPAGARMDYTTSVLSPRKYLFPQREELVRFDRSSPAGATAVVDAQPTAIVGAHPCDITACHVLDKAFGDGNKDPYYAARREKAVIIGMDCPRPCDEHQFCLDMGSLYPTKGYDLFCQDLGDRYYVTVGSDRGRQLVEKTRLFTPASETDLLAHEKFEQAKSENFVRKLPFDASEIPDLLGESYDSLIWDAVARRCYSCGSCNLTCPTCYCFNVFDDLDMNLTTGQRIRQWDACQLAGFAEVAGGENFREHASQRLRHRVFRKGKYMLEQFGELGCVGCGRCDRNCTASISIRKTFQQLWEAHAQRLAEAEQARTITPISEPASHYLPRSGKIIATEDFTEREKWFKIAMDDGLGINYLPGQFVEVSLFGIGEAPISICSACADDGTFEMCVRSVGDVTNHLRKYGAGEQIGVRGPFGNGFDMERLAGQDLLFIAGGLGLAPCRSFIQAALNSRNKFGKVTILYGARNPKEMLFRKDLAEWTRRPDCDLLVTVDRPDADWVGHVGVITTLFKQIEVDPNRTAVFIIGPPVMFKYAVMEVLARGVPEGKVLCSLERRMKCGLGKCGHCQIRDIYVCQEGPVFTYQQVKRMREGI